MSDHAEKAMFLWDSLKEVAGLCANLSVCLEDAQEKAAWVTEYTFRLGILAERLGQWLDENSWELFAYFGDENGIDPVTGDKIDPAVAEHEAIGRRDDVEYACDRLYETFSREAGLNHRALNKLDKLLDKATDAARVMHTIHSEYIIYSKHYNA